MADEMRYTESRGPDGYREIGIYHGKALVAVITRPVSRGKWFLHRAGVVSPRGVPYRTRKAAIEAVNEL